ncbi:transport protein [Haemophilus influenzae]|nr:transport protein [Haemophilus influenzae]
MATAMSAVCGCVPETMRFGNVAVILAGMAVYFFQSKYPDLIVAFVLAFLALQASQEIIKGLGRN